MAAEFPMVEVNRHRVREDAWIVIGGTIYDISDWVSSHPGGAEILLSCAGADASQEFEDVGHSSDARERLSSMAVGTVREATSAELAEAEADEAVPSVVVGVLPSGGIGAKDAVVAAGEKGAGYASAALESVRGVLPSTGKTLFASCLTVAAILIARRVINSRVS